MDKIKLKLPTLRYKNLPFVKTNNITIEGRAAEFEDQNSQYIKWGFLPENTSYSQTFDIGPDILSFAETLFPRYSVSVIKQYPGNTIPSHLDTYYTFCKKNNVNSDDVIRVNIFLENWKTGHYFEINENPVLQWKRGDAIIITTNEYHLSGNMGIVPKYTMQVTGVKNEFKGC